MKCAVHISQYTMIIVTYQCTYTLWYKARACYMHEYTDSSISHVTVQISNSIQQ
jgi:hypothetical protein